MKVFVTGADGLLGTHIVLELLQQHYEVRVFLLPNSPSKTLDGLPIERTYGNILEPATIQKAMQGCDAVIHAAASTAMWPTRNATVRRINIDGTDNMIAAALQQNVRRFVYVGSGSSFDFGTKEKPGDENSPFTGGMYKLDYIDSKYIAQEHVLQAVRERGLPALVVAPTFMFGPHDSKPGGGQIIINVYQGKVPAFSTGGKNYVHARDVATAIVNSLKQGGVGECYLAGHENLTWQEVFTKIAIIVGVHPPSIRLPPVLTKSVGYLSTAYGKLFRANPPINHALAIISCDGQYFSAQKAVRELNMPQTPVDTAIQESFEWLKANGYC